jgi:hypothetical protein
MLPSDNKAQLGEGSLFPSTISTDLDAVTLRKQGLQLPLSR